ncbi:MFS transporter [Candidatus Sodalis sp. SoCistrobi]|uniref:MFS transporter n=1 Tax=Candidatus Sodalis sp. SoCistrobi TaxID=1922216 RepID=UPI00093CDED5|nr:MFS transporter [Candidatus Sodalis sp. SoCistrobi]
MKTSTDHPSLNPALTLIMAIATGLAVASNYYAQPLLDAIARTYHLSVREAGFIVTAAQLSYACGLMFLVPLGDKFERRSMIVVMSVLAAIGMVITASAPSLPVMLLGTALTGLFSVVAQILVPLAASLADPARRGKVVGTIMSGLLLGILLARTAAGALADLGGWQTVYWLASALMIVMAVILWFALPRYKQYSDLNYRQLLGSIFSIYRHSPVLRNRSLLGCLSFACFSNLWTSMAFLLAAPPFHYSESTIGLFGLVGAAGALAATRAGTLSDRGKAKITTLSGLLLLLFSWVLVWYGQYHWLSLVLGIIVLDLAAQGLHITNQSVIYRRMPEARNRLTSGYMTSYFAGGAFGSLVSATAYQSAGWNGVSLAGGLLCLVNLLLWLRGSHHEDAGLPGA